MKEARFAYKCRRCGGKKDNTCCDPQIAWKNLIDATILPHSEVRMLDVHLCKDGGMGMADLIGFGIVETCPKQQNQKRGKR
jgi:hypothetical protein